MMRVGRPSFETLLTTAFVLDWRFALGGPHAAPRGVVIAAIDDDTVSRAPELTLRKFNGGISDDEAAVRGRADLPDAVEPTRRTPRRHRKPAGTCSGCLAKGHGGSTSE